VTPPDPNRESEPFELLKPLGSGGFAHTYKARVLDEDLARDWGCDIVAIKVPLGRKQEHVLTKEVEMNGLLHLRLRELQAANLVSYLGFCVFRGQIVMAMQYVAGGSLRGLIGSVGAQKPLPLDQAVEITEGILAGLAAIHRERIFHRDIKPENILMDGRVPKISDLGISRMLDSNEHVEAEILDIDVQRDDMLLLVTDGVAKVLEPAALEALLRASDGGEDARAICTRVFQAVLARRPDDDTTLGVVIVSGSGSPGSSAA
jgi:serine/threonine protein kinase